MDAERRGHRGIGLDVPVLGRASLASLGALGASATAAVGVQLVLARALGVAEFGVYLYALTWMNVLSTVSALGYNAAALRYGGALRAVGDWGRLSAFVRRAITVAAVGGLTVAALAAAVATGRVMRGGGDTAIAVLAATPLIPLLGLSAVATAVLQALGRVVLAQVMNGITRPVLLIAMVGAIAQMIPKMTAVGAMGLNVLVTLFAAVGGVAIVRRCLPRAAVGLAVQDRSDWDRSARSHLLIVGSQLALRSADVLVVGVLLGARDAGILGVAARLASVVGFVTPALNSVAAPAMAGLHARGDRAGMRRLAAVVGRAATASGGIAAGLLLIGGGWMLGLFGPGFEEGLVALLLLVAGQLVVAVHASAGFVLTMSGREAEAGRTILGAAVVHVALLLVLVPVAGLSGAALATLLSVAARNVLLDRLVRRHLGVSVVEAMIGRGGPK